MSIPPREVSEWCAHYLGAPAAGVIFSTQQISSVIGVRLLDDRRVVVKVRPPAERIRTCTAIQQLLWERGFPCPQPLAGPAPYGDAIATAEALVDGGAACLGSGSLDRRVEGEEGARSRRPSDRRRSRRPRSGTPTSGRSPDVSTGSLARIVGSSTWMSTSPA